MYRFMTQRTTGTSYGLNKRINLAIHLRIVYFFDILTDKCFSIDGNFFLISKRVN